MIRSLGKVGLVKGVAIAAGLVNASLLVIYLAPVEVGLYFFIRSSARIVGVLCSLGVPSAVVPCVEASKADARESAPAALAAILVSLVLAFGAAVLAMVVVPVLSDAMNLLGDVPPVWGVLAATTVLELTFAQYYRTRSAYVLSMLFQNSHAHSIILSLCLPIIMLLDIQDKDRFTAVLFFVGISAAVPVLVALFRSRPLSTSLWAALQEIPSVLRIGLGFLPSNLVVLGLPHILVVILAGVAGPTATAVFGLAQRIAGVAGVVNMSAATTFIRASRLYRAGDAAGTKSEFARYIVVTTTGTALIAVAYVAVGRPIVDLVAVPAAYPHLHGVTGILIAQQLVVSAFGFSAVFARNLGRYRLIAKANGVAGLVAVSVAGVLCGFVGAYGAALAALAQAIAFHMFATISVRARDALPEYGYPCLKQAGKELVCDSIRWYKRR